MSKPWSLGLGMLLLAACGGTQTPPSQPESTAPEPKAEAQPDAAPDERETQRREFMNQCEKSPDRREFCECSFDVASTTLTPEEMRSDKLAADRARALEDGIRSGCSDKLPESLIREGFLAGCASQTPTLEGFCDCTWTTLRKSAEPHEIATMGDDPRLTQATKACMAKIPQQKLEADLKGGFMKGCMKRADAKPFCDCAWKAWRSEMTPIEMVMAGPRSKKMDSAVVRAKEQCGKLAPKK